MFLNLKRLLNLLSIKLSGCRNKSSGNSSTSVLALAGSGTFGLVFSIGCVKSGGSPIRLRRAAAVTPVLS